MRPTVETRSSDFSMHPFRRLQFPDHLHAQIEILLPRHGDFHARVDGANQLVHPGDALLIFPHLLHGYPVADESEGLMLIFSPALLPDMGVDWEAMHPRSPVVTPLNEDARYAAHRLAQLPGGAGPERETLALLHLLLSGLLQGAVLESAERPIVGDILYNALGYLSGHYAQSDVSLKRTAHAVGVNEYHLSHLFNARLHMDFRRYVNLLRTDKARQLLTQKALPIEEVAFRCGFSNLRSFDRVFGQICGCTPRVYRKALFSSSVPPPA